MSYGFSLHGALTCAEKKIGHIAFLHNVFQCTAVQDKKHYIIEKKNLLKSKTTEKKKGVIKTQCITCSVTKPKKLFLATA